jgi:hypothetical protein
VQVQSFFESVLWKRSHLLDQHRAFLSLSLPGMAQSEREIMMQARNVCIQCTHEHVSSVDSKHKCLRNCFLHVFLCRMPVCSTISSLALKAPNFPTGARYALSGKWIGLVAWWYQCAACATYVRMDVSMMVCCVG